MHQTLEAIKNAWDKNVDEGRDEKAARALSDKFVADNPDIYESYAEKTLAQCVRAVDVFRAAEMDEEQWRMEAWLLHRFAPQEIGGEYNAQVRIT